MSDSTSEFISLKWGTLKAWRINSERGLELLRQYMDDAPLSAMCHRDTPEKKATLCQLIDESQASTIHLDWDGRDVTKEEAKRYVLNYGQRAGVGGAK